MDTMRRFFVSLTALGLFGVVTGCAMIDGLEGDCGCQSCGCGTGAYAGEAPMPIPGSAMPPATKAGTPATPESIKEMPKALDTNTEEVPLRLTPEAEGLDLK